MGSRKQQVIAVAVVLAFALGPIALLASRSSREPRWQNLADRVGHDEIYEFGECKAHTGGTCSYLGCDRSRNAKCVQGKCLCDTNACANDFGVCSIRQAPLICPTEQKIAEHQVGEAW